MKKLFLIATLSIMGLGSYACTNFIVGKKASKDGSVFCSYNADDYGLFIGLCHFPAGKHAKGEMRKVIGTVTSIWARFQRLPRRITLSETSTNTKSALAKPLMVDVKR